MTDTVGARVCLAPASTRCRRARHAAWWGSPVGGRSDVFSGGSPWTVTGPLFDLLDLLVFTCSLVMVWARFLYAFRRRQPTRTGLTGMLTSAQLLSGSRSVTLGGYNHGVVMRSSLGLT